MKRKWKNTLITGLIITCAPLWCSANSIAGNLHGLQGTLDSVYEEMLPMCSQLIGAGRAIAGFAALIYISARVWRLPELKMIDQFDLKTSIEGYWRRWGCQGKDFWKAALNAHHDGNNNLAVFLTHQSVESTLNAIIRITLGYRLSVHNLKNYWGSPYCLLMT